MKPEDYVNVKSFDALTPINPESWLRLETGPTPLSDRASWICSRRWARGSGR